MATTKIVLSGPLFDGSAQQAAGDNPLHAAAREFHALRRRARVAAALGHALGVEADPVAADLCDFLHQGGGELGSGMQWVISGGVREGRYSWPWLEGTSRRNASTGFAGYGTFRRTRLRMRTQVTPFAQQKLNEYLPRMGGEAV